MKNNMKYGLGRIAADSKLYMILGFDFVVVMSLFYEFFQYLQQNRESVQYTELWIFSMATPIIQTVMLISFLVLICDLPYMDRGFELYIMRTTKRKWLIGQYGALLILVLLFTGLWMLFLCPAGNGCFSDTWSSVFRNAANMPVKDTIGFAWDFRIISSWLYVNTPYTVFFQTLLLQLLKYFFVGLLILTGNILNRRNQSIAVIFLFWLLDYSISEMERTEALFYISPFTLTKLDCLNLGFEYDCPDYAYSVLFMLAVIMALMMLMAWKVNRIDFQKCSSG